MRHAASKDPRVEVTGEVQDLRPFLAKSKVYVCPVLSGSGVRGKILEAMAMRVPVVSTSVAAEGIPIDQGENAFIADAPDVMADFLELLLHDPGKSDSMGDKGRQTVERFFNWESSIDTLERTLKDCVAKRSFHQVA
jgi:glycosyltransferase involved in cell wall biosynthesis